MEKDSEKKEEKDVVLESSTDDRPVLHTEFFIELLSKEDQKVFRPENFQSDKK